MRSILWPNSSLLMSYRLLSLRAKNAAAPAAANAAAVFFFDTCTNLCPSDASNRSGLSRRNAGSHDQGGGGGATCTCNERECARWARYELPGCRSHAPARHRQRRSHPNWQVCLRRPTPPCDLDVLRTPLGRAEAQTAAARCGTLLCLGAPEPMVQCCLRRCVIALP